MASENSEIIDVDSLISELGVEGACQTAEVYFAKLERTALAKPFDNIAEAPRILSCFAQLLHGMDFMPGMSVVDFGSGACWSSRFLTQLGLKVYCLDVSESALQAGKELYKKQPVFGMQPEPEFLHFNGTSIDLPDKCIDRIMCFDAFHHVPNQEAVIREMGRILKDSGIAGFSEPGPDHSESPQAQSEMRMYRVIENNIEIRKLWNFAQTAGFTGIKLGVFNPFAIHVSLDEFESYLKTQHVQKYFEDTHTEMLNRRLFFLQKGGVGGALDSRQTSGLKADLSIELKGEVVKTGSKIRVTGSALNSGSAIWLPTTGFSRTAPHESLFDNTGRLDRERLHKGAVHLGVHLFDIAGNLIDRDYSRSVLTPDAQAVLPGQRVHFEMEMPAPSAGDYILEFDLVSEWICWFESNGSKTVKQKITVR